MSIVNHKYKHVFVHIPKCAGSSMEHQYWVRGNSHFSLHQLYRLHPNEVKQYFKWTFIRNPFDRIASAYYFFPGHTNTEREIIKYRSIENGFSKFLLDIEKYIDTCHHIKTLTHYIKCPDGIEMDFIGRVENLNNDWYSLLVKMNIEPYKLPHFNKNKNKPIDKTYFELYNDQDKSVIKSIYKEELITYYPELLSF